MWNLFNLKNDEMSIFSLSFSKEIRQFENLEDAKKSNPLFIFSCQRHKRNFNNFLFYQYNVETQTYCDIFKFGYWQIKNVNYKYYNNCPILDYTIKDGLGEIRERYETIQFIPQKSSYVYNGSSETIRDFLRLLEFLFSISDFYSWKEFELNRKINKLENELDNYKSE
jgi:hypothetical protein